MFTSILFDCGSKITQVILQHHIVHHRQSEQKVTSYVAHHHEQWQQSENRQLWGGEPKQWRSVHQIRTDVCGSSALLKPGHQREGQRLHCARTTNKQHLLTSSLLLCIRCKECSGIAAKQHAFQCTLFIGNPSVWTYSEGRSLDIQPCWVLSQGTCDSSWNQIPFYRWTRSWEWKINTIFRHKQSGLQQHRVVVWWWYFW